MRFTGVERALWVFALALVVIGSYYLLRGM